MPLHPSNADRAGTAHAAMSTSARVAWIDLYRFELDALVPGLAAIDAVALALAALDNLDGRSADPVALAQAFASTMPSCLVQATARVGQ